MKSFEVDFTKSLKDMSLDVKISHSSWEQIKNEVGD
jgi:hypothetical protein